MNPKLQKAFKDYIDLLIHQWTITILIDNTKIDLLPQVNELETNQFFHNLIIETRHTFSGFQPKKDRGNLIDIYKGEWENRVSNFFRRSNTYYDIYLRNNIDIDTLFNSYVDAFQRKEINEIYLAPLEYVNFAKDFMDFGQFQIKKFTINDLNDIFQNRINKIFYSSAFIDSEQIEEYWFLCAAKSIPAPKIGVIHLEQAEGMDICHVDIEYANYPEEILPFLKSLSLFDWGSDWLKESFKHNKREIKDIEVGWLRFHIPFVYIINDNLLDSPNPAPNLSLLPKEQYFDESTQEVYFQRPSYIDLDNDKTIKFQEFVANIHRLILGIKTEENNWQFLNIAINLFIKAFFSNGIEQLLWHITSIEALLGQNESSTKNIANRIGYLLGNKEAKYFREKLYKFRSDLVHGKDFKNQELYINHLWKSRSLSRKLILWFIHYLYRIETNMPYQKGKESIPTREDIHLLIDSDKNQRNRIKRLLINLPNAFPYVEEWVE